MGRRKIEMEMVKDAGSRQVTFSKRRNGLFKKANELAILCGAELAIVVFSPGGKPFSFGHPSVDAVAHRFLQQREAAPESGGSSNCSSKDGCAKAEKLKKRLVNLTKQLEAEKKKGGMLERALEEKRLAGGLGPGPGPDDVGKLEKTKRRLEKLREEVKVRAREMEAAASLVMLAAKKEKC